MIATEPRIIATNSERVAIFSGPSANVLHDPRVVRFPPASAGDLAEAHRLGIQRIVYADSLFFDASPTHREIMEVIGSGVELVGCASAGALRAAGKVQAVHRLDCLSCGSGFNARGHHIGQAPARCHVAARHRSGSEAIKSLGEILMRRSPSLPTHYHAFRQFLKLWR